MFRLFSKKLFFLSLTGLIVSGFLSCAPRGINVERKENLSLVERIEHLYQILSVIRVNSAETREFIKDFFLNDDALDRFVVLTTLRLIRAKVYDLKIRGVRIESISLSGNRAQVKIKYWGNKRFPLFKGKVEEVQQWVRIGGKWYLEPSLYLE